MPSALCCQSRAERSQSQTAEARPPFARVGWNQQGLIEAFVISAVHVMVVCQPWARESLGEEEKGKKKGNGPTVDLDFQIKSVAVGLSSL